MAAIIQITVNYQPTANPIITVSAIIPQFVRIILIITAIIDESDHADYLNFNIMSSSLANGRDHATITLATPYYYYDLNRDDALNSSNSGDI